jgi:hypothetical protein
MQQHQMIRSLDADSGLMIRIPLLRSRDAAIGLRSVALFVEGFELR